MMIALRSAAWVVSARQLHLFPHPSSFVATRRMSSQRTFHSSTHLLYSQKDDNTIQDDDELKYRKYYSISGTGQKSVVTMETNTGHTLQTDVPTKMGGSDTAP